jgi:hypothetical protein
MSDSHPPCGRCRTTEPDAFDAPTSAFCVPCWEYMTDHGRRFGEWIENTLRPPWRGWFG